MKIHANAPLGPKGRALMVRRVIEEGWTVKRAAQAAGVFRAHHRQMSGALALGWPLGPHRPFLRASCSGESHSR
jgi:hypothetical protein